MNAPSLLNTEAQAGPKAAWSNLRVSNQGAAVLKETIASGLPECKFCALHSSKPLINNCLEDLVLYETERFVVTPTKGSIVPGWILVTPKKHFLCIGSFDNDHLMELEHIRKLVAKIFMAQYGCYIEFEHGPCQTGEKAGCGVDHAHLHFVAMKSDIIGAYNNYITTSGAWKKIESIREVSFSYARGRNYLFFGDLNNNLYLLEEESIGSQSFRKVIAAGEGIPFLYDWKKYNFHDNIKDTVLKLKSAFQVVSSVGSSHESE